MEWFLFVKMLEKYIKNFQVITLFSKFKWRENISGEWLVSAEYLLCCDLLVFLISFHHDKFRLHLSCDNGLN